MVISGDQTHLTFHTFLALSNTYLLSIFQPGQIQSASGGRGQLRPNTHTSFFNSNWRLGPLFGKVHCYEKSERFSKSALGNDDDDYVLDSRKYSNMRILLT